LNEGEPRCSNDGKWVYYIDHGDNRVIKRIPVEGGTSETVLNVPVQVFDVSPDGEKILTYEVRESDHKMEMRIDSVETHKTQKYDLDARALWGAYFVPDGQSVVFAVREKNVDNLWLQAIGGSVPRQLTHFTSERIQSYRFSPDGKELAIQRGHADTDAVLLRDTSK
jgi:Tol biopolymer transport system component